MANSAWQATIQDSLGNIVEGAEVQVLFESSGTPATIYSDRAGTPLVNPFLTGSTGFAQFYAPAGNYRVVATKDTFTNTWRDQRLGESQGYDVQSSATDFTEGRVVTTDSVDANGGDVVTKSGGYLGDAATKTVQASGSDFTAGRVALTEGLSYVNPRQFGFGVQNAPTLNQTSLNNYLEGGIYSCANATTPFPGTVNAAATLFVLPRLIGSSDHEITQILEWRGETWRRSRVNAQWSSWYRLWTTEDFTSAPVDATTTTKGLTLKNSFSSGTGVWVDNETGMKIQMFTITSTSDVGQTFTFPEAFSTECLLAGAIGLAGNLDSKTTTQMTVNRLDTYSGTYSMTAIAIGY